MTNPKILEVMRALAEVSISSPLQLREVFDGVKAQHARVMSILDISNYVERVAFYIAIRAAIVGIQSSRPELEKLFKAAENCFADLEAGKL